MFKYFVRGFLFSVMLLNILPFYQNKDYNTFLGFLIMYTLLIELFIFTFTANKTSSKTATPKQPRQRRIKRDKHGREQLTKGQQAHLLNLLDLKKPADGNYGSMMNFDDEFYTHDLIVDKKIVDQVADWLLELDKEIKYIEIIPIMNRHHELKMGIRKIYDHNNNYKLFVPDNSFIITTNILQHYKGKYTLTNEDLNWIHEYILSKEKELSESQEG